MTSDESAASFVTCSTIVAIRRCHCHLLSSLPYCYNRATRDERGGALIRGHRRSQGSCRSGLRDHWRAHGLGRSGMAVSQLENGQLHVNVLLLPRDKKQQKAESPVCSARRTCPADARIFSATGLRRCTTGRIPSRTRSPTSSPTKSGTLCCARGNILPTASCARACNAASCSCRASTQPGPYHPRGIDGDEMTAYNADIPTSDPGMTQLLLAWRDGDDEALARLTPLVHKELQRIARAACAVKRQPYPAGDGPRRTRCTSGSSIPRRSAGRSRALSRDGRARDAPHLVDRRGPVQPEARRRRVRITITDALEVSDEKGLDIMALDERSTPSPTKTREKAVSSSSAFSAASPSRKPRPCSISQLRR